MPYTVYVYPNRKAKQATQIIRDVKNKPAAKKLQKRFGDTANKTGRHAIIKKSATTRKNKPRG